MAIKLKKWKPIISFCAFFAGMSLLIGGTLKLADSCRDMRYFLEGKKTAFSADYQETGRFQNYMEQRLKEFITIGIGGRLWYNSDGYGYWDEEEYWQEDADYAVEEFSVSVESGWIDEGFARNTTYGGTREPELDEEKLAERNKEEAKKLHDSIKKDKNLLYRISSDGKELYSNMEDYPDFTGEPSSLPNGYNFFLHFNGREVKMYKDGNELNVYGDGIYREEECWYVPGYQNFKTADEWKNVEIIMLTAKEPLIYSYNEGNYSRQGIYRYGENELYYTARETLRVKRNAENGMLFLLAGVLLLGLSFFFRKEKREVDRQLAIFTGKIWIEAKLAVICALIGWLMYVSESYYGSGFLSEIYNEYEYYYWEGAAEASAMILDRVPQVIDLLVTEIIEHPFVVALLFWGIYLFINDIRRNKGCWKHGLIFKVSNSLYTRNLKLPLAKQMIRRILPVTVASVGICTILIIVVCVNSFRISEPVPIIMGMLCWLFLMITVFLWYLIKTKRLAIELDLLGTHITAIHNGDYLGGEDIPKQEDLKKMTAEIQDIRQGLEIAIDERLKSERMKVELVANVSHDIKTPLTSIISYVEFLKQEEDLPSHVKDYIKVLDEKSQRLKNIVQDVFSVSKAATGQLEVTLEKLDFGKLLRQTLADMDERIKNSAITIKAEIPEEAVMIHADGQRMYRVFQNLIVNALKYSLEGTRVYVTLKEDETAAIASITNTSREEIPVNIDFTERFMRGDNSRTDGGSGLGLSIAKSFTEACGGNFQLETIADLFVVTVAFERDTDERI